MDTKQLPTIRTAIANGLDGHESHIDFDSAVEDFPAEARGRKPAGATHTAWQLIEHMRIAQWDILEFSRDARHQSPKWPEGYWPMTEAPPDPEAWDRSIAAFRKDAQAFKRLIEDPSNDLVVRLPHGDGQTLLREALVLASHNSYHLGQLMFLKKALQVA